MNGLATAALMCLMAFAGVFIVLAFLVLCIRCLKLVDFWEKTKLGSEEG